jgi:O-antigen/teichoic acid export membrane protein
VLLAPVVLAAQTAGDVRLVQLFAPVVVLSLFGHVVHGALLGTHDFAWFNGTVVGQHVGLALAYGALFVVGALSVESALVVLAAVSSLNVGLGLARVVHRVGLARPGGAARSLRYGLRVHGIDLGVTLSTRLDLMIVPAFIGASGVGLYAVARSVAEVLLAVVVGLSSIVLPLAASGAGGRDVVVAFTRATALAGVVSGALIMVGAVVAVPLLYGQEFEGAVVPALILVPGCVLLGVGKTLSAGLAAEGRPGAAALSQLITLPITAVGLLLFLPLGGIEAAAFVAVAAYAASCAAAATLFTRGTETRIADLMPRGRDLTRLIRTFTTASRSLRRLAGMRQPRVGA